MKKILFMLLIAFQHLCVQAQNKCFDFCVKTPRGNDVKACSSGGFSSYMLQNLDYETRGYAISPGHVYEGATNSYNCHGYAWHVKEGGIKVWINSENYDDDLELEEANVNTYWGDGSYFWYDYYMRRLTIVGQKNQKQIFIHLNI